MPASFLYLLALLLYLLVAAAVWLGCAVLALGAQTRRRAWRTALSMAATFPSVLLAQVTAAPIILAWLALGLAGVRLIDPKSSLTSLPAIVVALTVMLAAVGGFALASLYGFYVGWSVAWRLSGGVSASAALRAHRPLAWVLDAGGGYLARRVAAGHDAPAP